MKLSKAQNQLPSRKKSTPMTVFEIKQRISHTTIQAHRERLIGDDALEAAISHQILMVLQSRQIHNVESIPMDFDICGMRLAVFNNIVGRDAQ